ncbi:MULTISPECIES: RagB/SusD family nutrient uptake outer membrane protein [Chryseobacterium]|uniref:RagB/SusD family nutrient uptake outer membrane protein n=1 Tax=Chryseobacterium sp. R2A-55 TaxID=2744445 RepID=UPI001F2CE603|nr:RagB/SusD family nutrient uptake outer membrane protein [Chryseobacterium sp. R2A-55]
MKKYFLILVSILLLHVSNSCSERELDLFPNNEDPIELITTEQQLQQLLNSSYFNIASANALGTEVIIFGEILGDKIFNTSNGSYLTTYNMNYSGYQNQFEFYSKMYNLIVNANLIINNTVVKSNPNVMRIKGEAYILRGYAYYILASYYSPSPTSGVNQEYGVPIVLENYNVLIKPARATVAQVYDQIISDLKNGAIYADSQPESSVLLGQDAAKLLLSRVYLTRRASGDAQLALQLTDQLIASAPSGAFKPVTGLPIQNATYVNYFAGSSDSVAEKQPETIWELDINTLTQNATGIGSNVSLPCFFSKQDPKRSLLANNTFYTSFASTDARRGLFSNTAPAVPTASNGWWIGKYPRLTERGNYKRNIKILRYSEAYLNRIEALHLTNQDPQALAELNAFAASRNGNVYTGANILNDILEERSKELFAEGQRFLDLKRYNLPIVKPSNCAMNCSVQPGDKLYVLPISQISLNNNENLTQYPGY